METGLGARGGPDVSYQPRHPPYAHQVEARRLLDRRPMRPSDLDVMAWLMEYGTGKTKIMLDEFGEREEAGDLRDLLVIASAGVYLNWRDQEMPEHLSDDLRDRLMTAAWQSGSRRSRTGVEHLLAYTGKRPRALLVNVEAISSVQRARDACETFLSQSRRVMCVVDESTLIKGWDSRRTKHVIRLGQLAAARRIATGLVAPNSPQDLFSQFEFLDWRILGFQSFYGYRARYAILKKADVRYEGIAEDGTALHRQATLVVGWRRVEELAAKIAPYCYKVLKRDCLDLPAKVYEFHDVTMTDEQERIYRELLDFASAQLSSGEYVSAPMVITQILRRHQVLLGHVRDEQGAEHPVPSRRTDALVEILRAHAGKAIVWTPYDYCVREISARLRLEFGPGSVARFWGGNQKTREEEERQWKGDPECRFMVSTQAAGGAGRTWIVADLVVYYGSTHNLEHRMNSEDRAHRAGQTKSVTYVDMRVRGTVEDKIIAALRRKLSVATLITQEGHRAWLV